MTSKKMFVISLIVFLIGIFMINGVLGLGITPGRSNIDFSSNLEREIPFTVINTEHKNMNVAFSVQGDLEKYIYLSNKVESFTSLEDSKIYNYKIMLPEGLSPGLHQGEIVITELPEGIKDAGMVVQATVSVVTQVFVYVPYPGKYIDVSLDVIEKENGVNFYVPVVSRGKEDIKSVSAVIEIYENGEKIDSVKTNEISMKSNERGELFGIWNPNSPSKYKGVAIISYDGEIKRIEKEFNAGGEEVGLLGVSVNDFKLGDVARVRVLVQNTRNSKIENAYANLKVKNADLNEIANLKSENYEIPGNSNKEMILYWDTEKLEKGLYDSELKIDYIENFILKNLKIDVNEDSMSFSGVGFVVSSEGSGKTSITTILIMVIGFLVLINLGWFIWWIRNKKKKKGRKT